jgi:hypothetical protein
MADWIGRVFQKPLVSGPFSGAGFWTGRMWPDPPLAAVTLGQHFLVDENGVIEDDGALGFSAAASSATPPVISNVVPAVASAIGPTDILSFDVTDSEGFVRILLVADFPGIGIREVIHDGFSFSANYSTFGNSRSVITNGFHYTMLRSGGWPVSPVIIPYAIDTTGRENP